MIYLNIIGLFLSSFWCTTFIFLSLRCIFDGRRIKYRISPFWIGIACVFHPYFLVFSYILSVMVKEWKFCCIPFRFVLWSQNNLILHIQFSHRWSRGKEKNKICCFLTSYTRQAEFFLLIFFILWSFMHWTLNKRCLETWSCVSGYCTCGLFLCFRSLWNIRNISQKRGRVVRKPVIKR